MKERAGLGRGKVGGEKVGGRGEREREVCVCVCGRGRGGENVMEV